MTDQPSRFVITEAQTSALCERLREGAYLEPACRIVGISPGTAREYVARARNTHHRPPTPETIAFADAVDRASAEAENDALRVILSGVRGWQGPAWFLERRFPQRWAALRPREADEVTAAERFVGLLQRVLDDPDVDLSPEQRTAALALLREELRAAASEGPDQGVDG